MKLCNDEASAGGEHAAEIATTTVVKSLAASMVAALQGQLLQVERAIRRAFLAANQNIQREARLHPERRDMGTTLTTALIAGYELFVASVGDSRVYLWQDGEFKRLTQDDSVIIRLVNVGRITESQARLHPLDNQILHALGCGETLASLRITRHRLLPGDVVAVTSDGFWKWADLDAPRLFLALDAGPGALEDLAVSLVEEAYRAGSDDNITVALLWHNGGNHATQERVCNQEGDDHGR